MEKFITCLRKGIYIDFIFMLIGLFSGVLLATFVIKDTSYLKFRFDYTSNIAVDTERIISDENIDKVKSINVSWYTGGSISTYAYVDIGDISIKKVIRGFLLSVSKDSFVLLNKDGEKAYNDTAAKGFLKHLVVAGLDEAIITEYNDNYSYVNEKGKEVMGVTALFDYNFYEENSLDTSGKLIFESNHLTRRYMIIFGAIGLGIGLLFSIGFTWIFIGKLDKDVFHEYDNEVIYRTPFHKKLFLDSFKNFKNLKAMIMKSVLLGFVMVFKFIPIPSGFAGLGISFGYLFLAIGCMLFGPGPALLMGFISDVLGFIIKPDGMFFIGYTLQSMLACFFYSLCLYKTHITFTRTLISRVLVNFVCNVFVGSLCYAFILGFDFQALLTYIVTISFPKNLLYLIPQSLVLYFVIKSVSIPLSKMGLIDSEIAENISFF